MLFEAYYTNSYLLKDTLMSLFNVDFMYGSIMTPSRHKGFRFGVTPHHDINVSKSIYPMYTVQVSFNFLFVYHFIFRKKVTLFWSLGKVNFQKGMVEYYQSPKW